MFRKLLIGVAIVGGVGIAAWAQDPPATTAASRQDGADPFVTHEPGKAAERIKPDDLLRLSIVDDMLVAETTVRPGGPQLLEVEGLKTPVSVNVRHRAKDPARVYNPDFIDMNLLVREGERVIITTLGARLPGNVDCTRTVEADDAEFSIQFLQRLGSAGGSPSQVSLYVQNLQSPEERMKFHAESFTAFARSYPAEFTQYVRPLLETFAPQPHLFAVNDELGALVFPEVYGADETVRKQIAALVKQLADTSFAKRKQAEEALVKMGTRAGTELARLDRSKLDPEQAARVDTILTKSRPAYEVDRNKLRSDLGFLLDCMMSPTPQLRKAAWEQLQKTTGREIRFEDPPDEPTRTQRVYALRRELLPASATTLPAVPGK